MPYPTGLVDRAEHGSRRNAGICHPDANSFSDPVGDRDRSDMTTFSDQVGKYPVIFALLGRLELARQPTVRAVSRTQAGRQPWRSLACHVVRFHQRSKGELYPALP